MELINHFRRMMIVRTARTWCSANIPQTSNYPRRAFLRDLTHSPLPCYCSSEQAYHSSASKIQVPSLGGRARKSLVFPAVFVAGWFGLGGSQMAYADDDGEKEVDSYTIGGTNEVVKAGDSVLVKLRDDGNSQYMARIVMIVNDNQNNAKVRLRRYCRPDEAIGGRRSFHGFKELFLSNEFDAQSANTISGKYVVHSLRNYMELENVGDEDYYCRFEYNANTGDFEPDRVSVYCNCAMPLNPDEFMMQCSNCLDWFHPACENMSIEVAEQLEYFRCSACSAEEDVKKP